MISLACDDGDPCTIGESYDQQCTCNNGVFQDVDNDGVCDVQDQLHKLDDSLLRPNL